MFKVGFKAVLGIDVGGGVKREASLGASEILVVNSPKVTLKYIVEI